MLTQTNITAIEGKFRRSEIKFEKTFLFKEKPINFPHTMLNNSEFCIIYFIDSPNYSWYLTNKNLIIPSINILVDLLSLLKVDFINLKSNPEHKLMNNELDLFTKDFAFKIVLEEKSWPAIYNIFKFIISKNENTE
ncbi:hypothetical protein ABXT08_12425 [Chryseobacterium sp. NRRL B-14859]|uniref:hypothetical protein n=1 Tax=Chryseobacterium sp. NRRL B-14859 TaxID=1562763 RepID=UPI00339631D7